MRKLAAAAALPSGLALAGFAQAPAQAQVTIAISCSSSDVELRLCTDRAEVWAKATGNHIEFTSAPRNSNERLALYQQLLAVRSSDINVFLSGAALTWT